MQAYILYLPSVPERVANAHFLAVSLARAGFECCLVPGLDAATDDPTARCAVDSGARLSPGNICCSEGHNRISALIADSDDPVSLVVEDDVYIVDVDVLASLARNELDLPPALDWIQLFHCDYDCPEFATSPGDVVHGWLRNLPGKGYWGTWAYLISPKSAKALLANNTPIRHVADAFFRHRTSPNAFVSRWPIFDELRISSRINITTSVE